MITLTGGILILAVILLIVNVFGFTKRGKGLHESVYGFIPLGNPKLWAIIVTLFLLLGTSLGVGFGNLWTSGTSALSTASLGGEAKLVDANEISLDCKFATIGGTGALNGNTTFTQDDSDKGHYTAYVTNASGVGAQSINGTVTCTRSGNIEEAARVACSIKGDTYTNKITPQTDTNVYSIIARGSASSQVEGVAFEQTAYLNDGAVATTSSDQEVTELVFTGGSSAQAKETLGFYFTLPGDTVFNYLRADQDPQDVFVECGGETVGRITVVKQA